MSEAAFCTQCGSENTAGSKFCNQCGAAFAGGGPPSCGSCGKELEAGNKFCNECGHPVGVAAAAPQRTTAPPAAPHPAPPTREDRTAIWVGVGVAVLALGWMATQQNPRVTPTPHPQPTAQQAAAPRAMPQATAPVARAGKAPAGGAITGTIKVAEALQGQTPSAGFFFVMARQAGSASPMPLAVDRIPASTQPTPFSLGPENLMGGGQFSGQMDITVKWDQDGSVGKQPGDLSGKSTTAVSPGANNVTIVLDQKL